MLRPIEKSDSELVAQAQAGAREAVDELLRRHYDRLYAVCRRVAGNDADAADACQEALMAIVRGLPRFDGRSSFKTWSYRVATNATLDELRRRKRRPLAVDTDETPEPVSDDPSFEERLTENDNLLIYYAGHGVLDEVNSRGHWQPVDAEAESSANWISNVALTDVLNAMSAKHILVVADSCYSGTLTRSSLARLEAGMTRTAKVAWQRTMAQKRSRTALTSGGLAPVLDAGGGGHSIFAKAFIQVLETNTDVIEGQRLFQEISALVTWAAQARRFEQVPQYAPIKYAGHESGDFFLVPKPTT